MKKILAPDFPDWLLQIVNKVDWAIVPQRKAQSLTTAIKTFIAVKLPKKKSSNLYPQSEGIKRIGKDVPQSILDAMNEVDFGALEEKTKEIIEKFLNKYIASMPQKA